MRTAEDLAYVIFTSGSTGNPKGAMNTHRGICNRSLWMQDAFRLTKFDRVLQKAPFSFDVSVWEIFWPLLNGARLVMARPGGHQDSDYLVNLIANQRITVLHFVPTMLRVFLEQPSLDGCGCIRLVICSGEALRFELQEHFFARLGAELYNLYGPTEAAIDVTYWACERWSNRWTIPIGRPIANTQTYILDSHMQPVPVGVPGELHIGGDGLARRYLNRPELTAEKFVDNLSEGSGTWFTGRRLGATSPDGNIEFLGRLITRSRSRISIEVAISNCTQSTSPGEGCGRCVSVICLVTRIGGLLCTESGFESICDRPAGLLGLKVPEYMMPAFYLYRCLTAVS
jgi:amino acid adenylation domain-containing protein